MRELNCLRCGAKLLLLEEEQEIQLGRTGFLLGDLGNLLAGSLQVDLYVCPGCGKLEIYTDERP